MKFVRFYRLWSFYNSIQEHSAVYCGDELNADNAVAVPSFAYMSSLFGGIPRSLERGGCHRRLPIIVGGCCGSWGSLSLIFEGLTSGAGTDGAGTSGV